MQAALKSVRCLHWLCLPDNAGRWRAEAYAKIQHLRVPGTQSTVRLLSSSCSEELLEIWAPPQGPQSSRGSGSRDPSVPRAALSPQGKNACPRPPLPPFSPSASLLPLPAPFSCPSAPSNLLLFLQTYWKKGKIFKVLKKGFSFNIIDLRPAPASWLRDLRCREA